MKKQLLFLIFVLMPLMSIAKVNIDGIYYNLNSSSNTASVTYMNDGEASYSGYVKIPNEVIYEGTTYNVTSIGERAFNKCSGLTYITIPNSVLEIGSYAFFGCSGLTSLSIPNSVTTINGSAFRNCVNLTSVSIPNSVTTIGGSVFRNCSGLTSVTIPNTVTSIGGAAFYNCSKLTSVNIPTSITSISGSTFRNCSSLTSLTISNNVISIEDYAFSGSSLTTVVIPNSVTSISEGAFSGCSSLTSVTIPNSLNNIPNKLFANCTSLKNVYCYIKEVPTTAEDAFADTPIGNVTLHVPESGINKYKVTSPWSNFGNIVGIVIPKCAKPIIQYANGKLTYNCDTEGAVCQTTITDADIASYNSSEVQLSMTYNISVYATKDGYDNSDVAAATLCWVDVEPKAEGLTNGVAQVKAQAVLIQSNNGVMSFTGLDDGTTVYAYTVAGQMLGSANASGNHAKLYTNLEPGETAVVKIGNKSMKIVMR